MEDLSREYLDLFEGLFKESENMDIHDKLWHHFTGYVYYFYRNRVSLTFSSHCLLHVPRELFEKLFPIYEMREKYYRERLEGIFLEGIQQGVIRGGTPSAKYWSFKTKRDGVLSWMWASSELDEGCIKELWSDFWFGFAEKR